MFGQQTRGRFGLQIGIGAMNNGRWIGPVVLTEVIIVTRLRCLSSGEPPQREYKIQGCVRN
jgi:hypothetical protein